MEIVKFLQDQVKATEMAKEIKGETQSEHRFNALCLANAFHALETEYNVRQLIKDARAIEAYLKEQ